MGCLWSREADECERNRTNHHYVRRVVKEIEVPSLQESYSTPIVHASQCAEPLYGEYKCSSCGRYWHSLLSWRDGYQICKRCKAKVYPTNQRELRPSDRTRDQEDVGEHPKEFCQKCKQLGRYCGRSNKYTQRSSKWNY